MAEEDVAIDVDALVKMEIDFDNEDIEWALEDSFCEDPLLTLIPIVYTTKLDDMNTVKQNLRELSAEEITNKLQSENKPIYTMESLQNTSNSANFASFNKLSKLVQHVNFKARLQKHNTKMRYAKLLQQCKPCTVVLEHIQKTFPINKTASLSHDVQNESQAETALITQISVKVEAIDSFTNEVIGPETIKKVFAPSDSEITQVRLKDDVIEILCDSDSSEPLPRTTKDVNVSSKNESLHASKTIESQRNSMKNVCSRKNKISRKPPITESSDEDDNTALIKFKRKPAPVTSVATHTLSYGKIILIVLIHQKKEAFVYRVDPMKQVTDYYYVTSDYDEYKLAGMYPKEEKVIENYCCWFKREEVVTKICMRKNYSFAVQKFLRLPHSCHPGDCQCCCHSNPSKQSKQANKQQSTVVSKSLTLADSWIRGLLNRNQPASIGLVSKALSYIPKPQVKEKPVEKQPEKYLESILLRLKISGNNENNVNYVAELYEIGKNGDVVSSFLLNDLEKEKHIRRTYYSMGILTTEAEFCCWYKRERIMEDLRVAKISPAALKLIQRPHNCERKKCKCCCKPQAISLNAIDILPSTLKHTTAYEKNVRPLTIRFNFKSKFPIVKINSYTKSKIPNLTDASVAATVLSTCASKEDNQDLSISILSKFKNLKLGLTAGGELEAVLNGPARNLSIAELKVLSDILDLSTKQIALLGLSPEEFCNRINSKPCQSNPLNVIPGNLLISAPKITPLSPQKHNNYTLHQNKDTTESLTKVNMAPKSLNQNKPTNNELISKLGPAIYLQTQNKPIIETTRKANSISKANTTKLCANMYSSISNLMETKNKNYVESFKSFFKNSISSSFVVPEMVKFPPVHGLAKFTAEQDSLPKIAETFTLATPSTKASNNAVAGSSGISRRPRKETLAAVQAVISCRNINPGLSMPVLRTESLGNNQTPTIRTERLGLCSSTTKRTAGNIDNSSEDKRLRVKSPSKLMAPKTQVPVTAIANNLQTKQIPTWPKPIVIKKEPITNNIQSIINLSQSEVQINPNLPTQAYLVSNNVGTIPNAVYGIVDTTTALNNVYHVNGNGMTIATNANTNSAGMRYLTLRPLTVPKSNNIDKSMLAKILETPQMQPTALRPCLPPLAPLTTVPVVDDEMSDQAQLDMDVQK